VTGSENADPASDPYRKRMYGCMDVCVVYAMEWRKGDEDDVGEGEVTVAEDGREVDAELQQ
jgi:hypothetical protein